MASKKNAERRRNFAKNPGVDPDLRWYLTKLNKKAVTSVWGTTTTSTTTT